MSSPTVNPYLAARIHWNAHVGATLAAARVWQIMAVTALVIAGSALGGALYLGAQSKFVPYLVEVDHLGQVQAVKIADAASPADERIIHASLATLCQGRRRG